MSNDFFTNAYALLDFFTDIITALFGVMLSNPFLTLAIVLFIFGVAFELVQVLIHIRSDK